MEKLSCQACHIPWRAVKAALVQASDVFNPAPHIEPPGKQIWTFYDQEMKFWNHYGELTTFTAKDQPTTITRPTLFRYKGKIYPGNRVHSTWVGYEEADRPGLNMLFMRDFFSMWKAHRDSAGKEYPMLSAIADDNGDGVPEINRPEEIDAILAAVTAHLAATKFPLVGKTLVWVMDDRAYTSGTAFRTLPVTLTRRPRTRRSTNTRTMSPRPGRRWAQKGASSATRAGRAFSRPRCWPCRSTDRPASPVGSPTLRSSGSRRPPCGGAPRARNG